MALGWKFSKVNLLPSAAWLYLTLLFAWGAAQSIWGDGRGWLFLLNVAAVYLFAPAPIVLLLGIVLRRWSICAVALVACLWWAALFGRLYWPRAAPQAAGKELSVMTYNLLYRNQQVEAIVAALQAADADLIALYELSSAQATAIDSTLAEKYPHRVLDPQGVDGSGLLSRYPLKRTAANLPGSWNGPTYLYEVDVAGQTVTVLCAHPHASAINVPWRMAPTIAEREQSVESMRKFAASHSGPLLVPLDLNSTPMNVAYRQMTSVLEDAWVEAGCGLGHTFPGAASPGSSRPRFAGLLMPMWVVRIDYVFHSRHFAATDARFGPWDGYSDHRPVIARLVLKAETPRR